MPARGAKPPFLSEEARSARRSRKAFAAALGRLEAALGEACSRGEPWPMNVISGVRAALRLAAADPAGARLLVIEAAEDPDGVEAHRQLIESLSAHLRGAAQEHGVSSGAREEILLSGVLGMVAVRLTLGQAQTLPTITLEAAEFLLSPYFADDRARRLIAEAIEATLAGGG
jgi:hypothetical protein